MMKDKLHEQTELDRELEKDNERAEEGARAEAGAFHLLHLTYLFFQKIAETISFGERSARLGNGSDGQSALIKGRQEAAAECAERYDGDDEYCAGATKHDFRV